MGGSKSTRAQLKPWQSKLCDWLIICGLLAVTIVLENPKRKAFHQCIPGYTQQEFGNENEFKCGEKDPSLDYPLTTETVNDVLLIIYAFGPWIFTLLFNMIILCCFHEMTYWRSVMKYIEIILRMMFFSASGTEALVSVMKISIGRPRPNFYKLMELTSSEATMSSNHKQARMSFPSGHAALSFATLFLLTLNLFAAMRFVQNRIRVHGKPTVRVSVNNPHSYFYLNLWWWLRHYVILSILLVLCPSLLAVYIACTRVTDYEHHYADIAVGSMLGIAGALISYMMIGQELYGDSYYKRDGALQTIASDDASTNECTQFSSSEMSKRGDGLHRL